MDNSYEQQFRNNVQNAGLREGSAMLHAKYARAKIIIVVLCVFAIVILVAFAVMAGLFLQQDDGQAVVCEECNCSRIAKGENAYGDFSISYDEDGNVQQLIMICKADDGSVMELMEDYRYAERDANNNNLDNGIYTMRNDGEPILELLSDRFDKYVYFDGYSLVNMSKVYHCLYD